MALRFRKSIKLAPGIRMNLSGSGTSWTLGPRGASIGVGKRGTFLNTGMPGTGLSSRTQLSGASSATRARQTRLAAVPPQPQNVSLRVSVSNDGEITATDMAGAPATEQLLALAKSQAKGEIRGLLEDCCAKINGQMEALERLHENTPSPHKVPTFQAVDYPHPQPTPPAPLKAKWWALPGKRRRVAEANAEALAEHQQEVLEWNGAKRLHAAEMEQQRQLVEVGIYRDQPAMEAFLELALQDVDWPRETNVTFDLLDQGRLACLDVDLPEIEDMPKRTATVPQRGMRLSLKELSPTKVQRMYAAHVHGVAFLLVGETFAALPMVQQVVLSSYSQRRSASTGHVADEYLLSVRVTREQWSGIDFDHLQAIDVVEALAQFEMRRTMSKTGVFKAIVPLGAAAT
ncbi:DUF4236 domain-containing protein [Variovorax sp. M-6]|uniref:DUF4236 domain-containing protein n=1 Tax=Variovorax sp. M-6 TaxID=3233041 RepID=UPI003F9D4A50